MSHPRPDTRNLPAALNLEAKMYWHVEHGTGKYPELEALLDDKEALARAIGARCFPAGWSDEDIMELDRS